MSEFKLSSLRNSSVWGLYRIKDRIQMDPVYQREGDIWTKDKRQLLIDTIINQFDVPKIYLHSFLEPVDRDGKAVDFAVIDGKQRLNAIWGFIDGEFNLSPEFVYLKDGDGEENPDLANLTYADLGKKHPNIKTDFDSYLLDVVCIETDEVELIEELFSRLNEAVPLSAPEKRNAKPGPLPRAVRTLCDHAFFTKKLPFSNRRYRHFDLAAKILLATSKHDIVDTKKAYLDAFFEDEEMTVQNVSDWTATVTNVLNQMCQVFVDGDFLLRQIGMTMLYYYIFLRARERNVQDEISRERLLDFDTLRRENRRRAEENIAEADYGLLEFDRFTQSPNDAYAMRIRLAVLDEIAFGGSLGFELPDGD